MKIVDSKNKRNFYLIFPSKWCVYMEYQTVNYIKRSLSMNLQSFGLFNAKDALWNILQKTAFYQRTHIYSHKYTQTITHYTIFNARDTHIWCYLFGMSCVKSDQTGVRFALMRPHIHSRFLVIDKFISSKFWPTRETFHLDNRPRKSMLSFLQSLLDVLVFYFLLKPFFLSS